MPRLSDTMEEGNIIGWLKKVGDKVSPGDILAEVETDKATMDLESFHEGTLLYIGIDEGAVPVDGIIAVIGKEGEDYKALIKEDAAAPSAAPAKEVSTAPDTPAPAAMSASHAAPAPVAASDQMIKASPLAKSMAKENNLNLGAIMGTGEGGRIIKKDIEAAIASGGASTGAAAATNGVSYASLATGETKDIPLSPMRKTIALRLGESKFSAPHFYLTIKINMDRTVDARKAINAAGDVKVSYNDIIVKAAALALRKHPMINASWQGDKIVMNGQIDVGVAVAIDEGLLVPVIRNTDLKPLQVINAEVKEYAGRAREKRLKPEEMQGNTFTISNLGMFGIDEFTAIINPPASCILAVGGIDKTPVVQNGEIKVGQIMKVTLSCDHRVVDGATGAAYLKTLKSYLENPLQMLV